MKRTVALILSLLLLPVAARARFSSLDISGYVKYLLIAGEYPSVQDTLYDQLVHTRINTAWHPENPALRGEFDVRFQALYGDSVAEVSQFTDQVKTKYEFADLDATMRSGSRTFAYAQIDRFWLDYTKGDLEVTLGRQRVAWGTALVWNVIDLFNPKSVLDFDYEEKPGVDGLRLQYYTGVLSKVEVVAKPATSSKNAIVAALYSTNIFEYDLYGIAGIRNNRLLAGAAWAGSVLDGGFRGELLVSRSPDKNDLVEDTLSPARDSSSFVVDGAVVSLVVSADYTFANSFYIHSECLFNSNGKEENSGEYQQEAFDAGMLSPARWSIYQEFAYDINPLTRATLYGIYNPLDYSSIVVPMLSHSLATDLDLLVIGQFASGAESSEFGDFGKSVTIRLKYSF